LSDPFGWRNALFHWRRAGLGAAVLREPVFESGIGSNRHTDVARGNFMSLFTNGARLSKYIRYLLVGVPFWFLSG
jgi:hypothetical protein